MKSIFWSALVLVLFMAPAQEAMAQNTIQIRIKNAYSVNLNLGFGSATRKGTDFVDGTLTLQANGTWTGEVDARVIFEQELKGLGMICPKGNAPIIVTQRLAMVARKVQGFNASSQSITYQTGSANGGFFALEVKPVAAPSIPPGPCLDMHNYVPDDPSIIPLLPLNDGRWTNPPPAGYVIALPQRGLLLYVDGTVACDPTQSGRIACSEWTIRIERP